SLVSSAHDNYVVQRRSAPARPAGVSKLPPADRTHPAAQRPWAGSAGASCRLCFLHAHTTSASLVSTLTIPAVPACPTPTGAPSDPPAPPQEGNSCRSPKTSPST